MVSPLISSPSKPIFSGSDSGSEEDDDLFLKDRRSCFTENYLVFELHENAHITELYLEREDEVLDYSKSIVFAPKGRQKAPRITYQEEAET